GGPSTVLPCPPRRSSDLFVEVAGTHFPLVAGRRVPVHFTGKLPLLQFGVGGHAPFLVVASQFEHAVIQGVEAGQGDKLELVAHLDRKSTRLNSSHVNNSY